MQNRPISKSSDWTEVALEVPDNDDEIKLKDSKLQILFNDQAPKPPPRKHRKGLREKIESVAKSGLQALNINKKPVDEPLFTKKTIDYTCPCDEHDHVHHNRDHKADKRHEQKLPKGTPKLSEKAAKRRKNLSVVSLPNYNELKFSVANGNLDIEKASKNNSVISLPDECKKNIASSKKDYIARCRSFGSILPNQLLEKLKLPKTQTDIESDDSFGPLEDWDLKIIEHYDPKDTSLPRTKKPAKPDHEILKDLESLIVPEEETRPVPPVRRSESLIKKLKKRANEAIYMPKTENNNRIDTHTPPPTPIEQNPQLPIIRAAQLPTEDEEGRVEHSSLMKILEEFSIKDKQKSLEESAKIQPKKECPEKVSPSFVKFEKNNPIEDFLNAERAGITDFNKFTPPRTVELKT